MKSELDILLELNNLVIREIGLELDRQYNIIDQDTGIQLQFNGKLIKYYFGNNPEIIDNDKIFDVIHDSYLMNFFVSYYLGKVQSENPDLYIHSYYPIYDKLTNRSALQFKGNFNTTTRFYKNECLKFIEAIMILGDNPIDLSEYDGLLSIYEEMNNKGKK